MNAGQRDLEALRYPIGRVTYRVDLSESDRTELIERIARLPARLRETVAGMSDAALDTPYRPGGWTARQVIHHLPDSHMNAYVRFKLAVTETAPTIKTYEEAEWARLADSSGPVDVSLDLLAALHARWTAWLGTLDDAAWRRAYVHPQSGRTTLDRTLQLYAWHGEHHLGHVLGALQRSGREAAR
jgi:hypothetical protein